MSRGLSKAKSNIRKQETIKDPIYIQEIKTLFRHEKHLSKDTYCRLLYNNEELQEKINRLASEYDGYTTRPILYQLSNHEPLTYNYTTSQPVVTRGHLRSVGVHPIKYNSIFHHHLGNSNNHYHDEEIKDQGSYAGNNYQHHYRNNNNQYYQDNNNSNNNRNFPDYSQRRDIIEAIDKESNYATPQLKTNQNSGKPNSAFNEPLKENENIIKNVMQNQNPFNQSPHRYEEKVRKSRPQSPSYLDIFEDEKQALNFSQNNNPANSHSKLGSEELICTVHKKPTVSEPELLKKSKTLASEPNFDSLLRQLETLIGTQLEEFKRDSATASRSSEEKDYFRKQSEEIQILDNQQKKLNKILEEHSLLLKELNSKEYPHLQMLKNITDQLNNHSRSNADQNFEKTNLTELKENISQLNDYLYRRINDQENKLCNIESTLGSILKSLANDKYDKSDITLQEKTNTLFRSPDYFQQSGKENVNQGPSSFNDIVPVTSLDANKHMDSFVYTNETCLKSIDQEKCDDPNSTNLGASISKYSTEAFNKDLNQLIKSLETGVNGVDIPTIKNSTIESMSPGTDMQSNKRKLPVVTAHSKEDIKSKPAATVQSTKPAVTSPTRSKIPQMSMHSKSTERLSNQKHQSETRNKTSGAATESTQASLDGELSSIVINNDLESSYETLYDSMTTPRNAENAVSL